MEERLFFIGVAMGLYTWASKRFKDQKTLDTPAKRGLWHGAFCALAAFSVTLVVALSMETRSRLLPITGNLFTTGELYPALMAGLVFGVIGFWRGMGEQQNQRGYFLAEDSEWSETVFSAVLLASVLMYFVVQAFKIPSGSMESTLLIGDHLFVNKFIYGLRVPFSGKRVLALRPPHRGDIVVFRFPVDDPRELHCGSVQYRKDFIKRVIGLPGDRIQVQGGHVFVNGEELQNESYAQYLDGPQRQPESVRATQLSGEQYQKLWENHELDKELQEIQRDYFGPVTVPKDAFFAMGDNRDRSCDSRYWGPVEKRYLKGKAWFIYWPPSRMRLVQ
jgi:signal peptidase I